MSAPDPSYLLIRIRMRRQHCFNKTSLRVPVPIQNEHIGVAKPALFDRSQLKRTGSIILFLQVINKNVNFYDPHFIFLSCKTNLKLLVVS